jgi:hypothetical protein
MDRALFHRLLNIPEDVESPTYYQLLDINPLQSSPEVVREAVEQRKALLRRQIPGPQFLPVIARFEKELDKAAETLIDPDKRQAYHEHLKGHDGRHRKRTLTDKQRQYLQRIRSIIRRSLNEDGTLNLAKRPDLIDTLKRMDVPEKDIRYILEQIPKKEV